MIGGEGWGIFLDYHHWAFELFLEALTFAAGAAWGWARVKKHIHDDVARAARRIEEHIESDMDVVDRKRERHQG